MVSRTFAVEWMDEKILSILGIQIEESKKSAFRFVIRATLSRVKFLEGCVEYTRGGGGLREKL